MTTDTEPTPAEEFAAGWAVFAAQLAALADGLRDLAAAIAARSEEA